MGSGSGETMAVTFIIGNSFRIKESIFAPGTTISAATTPGVLVRKTPCGS